MSAGLVRSEHVLWDGPLFADEVGWQSGITESLREQYDLRSRRVIPAKEAMAGVVSIYFRPVHREWALVRYARRYRWIFEILLQQGLAGERRLLDNEFTPDDIEFLMAIVPMPADQVTPAVYDVLWRSAPFPEYVTVVAAIASGHTFTPATVLEETDGVDESDQFVFERLIRSHLIERVGSGTNPNSRREETGNTISVELEDQYQPTNEGAGALPMIVSEHHRIFDRGDFDALQINPDLDPESHLPDDLDQASTATGCDSDGKSDEDRSDILDEIAAEFDALTETSDDSQQGTIE